MKIKLDKDLFDAPSICNRVGTNDENYINRHKSDFEVECESHLKKYGFPCTHEIN